MEIVKTSNENYTLHVDRYPYIESRSLIEKLEDWWDHPSRKKYGSKIENYSLDPDLSHSLENSFKTKLNHGMFCFLFYRNDCISYGGMQVENDHAWMHRFASNPYAGKSIFNSTSTFLIPHQIFEAKKSNCKTYSLTFNYDNKKLFRWFRERIFDKLSLDLNNNGSNQVTKFDNINHAVINNCEQIVWSLDLTREDINEFCKF